MTREDYIWVAMRIFGIYLLVLAVTNLPGFITGLYFVSTIWNNVDPLRDGVGMESAVMLNQVVVKTFANRSINSILKALTFSVAGWYMLCRGGFLFSLVNGQNPLSDTSAEPPDETGDREDYDPGAAQEDE